MEHKMMNEGGWTPLLFGHALLTDGSQALLPLICEEHERVSANTAITYNGHCTTLGVPI